VWLVGSERLDLFLGAHRFAVTQGPEVLLCGATQTVEEGLEALEPWLSARGRRSHARVWLSGSLCRLCLQEAVPGAKPGELDRIARAEAAKRTGTEASGAVWLEGWREGGRAVVVVDAQTRDRVVTWRNRLQGKVRLRSLRPWWSQALEAMHQTDPTCQLLVVDDQESMTILSGANNELACAASIAPVGIGYDPVSLRQRALFGMGLDESQARTITLGPMSKGRASAADHLKLALGHWIELR